MKKKKSFRHALLALSAVVMSAVLFFTPIVSFAETKTDIRSKSAIPANLTGKTVIIQTNDIHGEVWSYDKTAALKKDLLGRGANVILIDLGDYANGTQDVNASNGRSAILKMNSAGYDLATIGNHEFDYGYSEVKNNLSAANFITLCANILGDNRKSILQPNAVMSGGSGLRIGFFGLCTPETPTKLLPSQTEGLKFLAKEELYNCAQEQADILRNSGADLVICLSHLGQDSNLAPGNSSSIDLYRNTHGIDLILDSHSHTAITSGPGNEPIQAAGAQYNYVGIVIIDNDTKRINDRFLISTSENVNSDPQAADPALEQSSESLTPPVQDPSVQKIPAAPMTESPEQATQKAAEAASSQSTEQASQKPADATAPQQSEPSASSDNHTEVSSESSPSQ